MSHGEGEEWVTYAAGRREESDADAEYLGTREEEEGRDTCTREKNGSLERRGMMCLEEDGRMEGRGRRKRLKIESLKGWKKHIDGWKRDGEEDLKI